MVLLQWSLFADRLRGEQFTFDIVKGKKVYVEAGKRVTARHIRQLQKMALNRYRSTT